MTGRQLVAIVLFIAIGMVILIKTDALGDKSYSAQAEKRVHYCAENPYAEPCK